MDNNTETNIILPEEPLRSGEAAPDPAESEKTVRTKVRKLYNLACLTMLIQFGIASAISGVISGIYTFIVVFKTMLENSHLDLEPLFELVMEETMASSLNPMFLLVTTLISYLIANLAAYFIGNLMTNRHHSVKIFGKIQMKPLDCILSVFSIIGVQMVSAIVQSLIMSLTNMSGVDEATASLLSFSDNIFQNILLVLYTVIIAAITEELLCRGVLMKSLAVKSTTFALLASSAIFGIMHGNLNQMFNGFLLGLVLGYAAIKSKSILLPIILHMCANGHAMLLSFLEYKLGENMLKYEWYYIIAMAVIGIAAAVVLVIRNGLPNDKTDGYPVVSTVEGLDSLENQKGLTWKLLFKSPAFWIFTGIYLLTAIAMITPLAA